MESDTAPLRGRNNSMPKGYIVFAVVTGLLAVAFIITYFVVDENINNGLKGISEVPPLLFHYLLFIVDRLARTVILVWTY